jgi:hypothetical protein
MGFEKMNIGVITIIFFIIALTLVQSVSANVVKINPDKTLSIDGVRTFPIFASDLSSDRWGTAASGIARSSGYITASWVSWRDNVWKIDPWYANALLPIYETTNPKVYTTSAIMTCPDGATCYVQTQPNVKNSPAFLGYTQIDEPGNGRGQYDHISVLQNNYNVIHNDDPNHPVFLNFDVWITGFPGVESYINTADAFSWDIYTITNTHDRRDFEYIWEASSITGGFGAKKPNDYSKPIYTFIQANGVQYNQDNLIFYVPTQQEVRLEIYTAITMGVSGIGLWPGHGCCDENYNDNGLLSNPSLYDSVKNILSEVHSLNNILILPIVGNSIYKHYDDITVSFSPNPTRDVSDVGEMRALSYILKRDSTTGVLYLIVVNKDASPQNGIRMTVNGLTGSTTATTLGLEGNRTLQVNNGRFTDNFDGFGVHIYQIGGGSAYTPPTNIPPVYTPTSTSNGNDVTCTFTVSPANTGIISANGIYVTSSNVMKFPYGSQVSFRAYPIPGYKFDHWLSMDGTTSYDNPYFDIMGGVDSKVAYFVPDPSYTPPVITQQHKYINIFDFLIRWIQSYLHI